MSLQETILSDPSLKITHQIVKVILYRGCGELLENSAPNVSPLLEIYWMMFVVTSRNQSLLADYVPVTKVHVVQVL